MTTSDRPLRIASIGAGNWGTHVAGQLLDDDRATLVALADVSADSRERAGATLGVPPEMRFEDYEQLLDTVDLDAVVVTTPHVFHHEHVTAAMDRDLHVYCEKPFTTDIGDARDLVQRAEARPEITMVGFQRHHEQPYIAAKERLAGQTPNLITAEITQDWIENFRPTWRANPDLSGGGELYDTGSHLLDMVLWFANSAPTSVSAQMVFDDEDERVDVHATLSIQFDSGAVANVTVSGDTPCVREHIHVWTDEGGTYIDGREWGPRELSTVDTENTTSQPLLDTSATRGKMEAFVDSVVTGEEPPVTVRHGYYVTAVTEAAYESAHNDGRRVGIDLDTPQ